MTTDWNKLADAYEQAPDEPSRWEVFQAIQEHIMADPDIPDDADAVEGAITFLRNRGLWND